MTSYDKFTLCLCETWPCNPNIDMWNRAWNWTIVICQDCIALGSLKTVRLFVNICDIRLHTFLQMQWMNFYWSKGQHKPPIHLQPFQELAFAPNCFGHPILLLFVWFHCQTLPKFQGCFHWSQDLPKYKSIR